MRTRPLLIHVTYWVVALFSFLFFFTLIGSIKLGILFSLVCFPLIIGLTYLFIYWIIPKFLFKGKNLLFILVSVALFLGVLNTQLIFVRPGSFYISSDNLLQNIDKYHWVFFFLIASTVLLTLPAILYESIRFWSKSYTKIKELSRSKDQPNYLEIKSNGKDQLIDINKIIYIESFKDHAHIHLSHQEIVTRMTLKKLNKLIPEFLRIHRSFIINPDHCQAFNSNEVLLNEIKIPLGSTYKDEVLTVLKSGKMNSRENYVFGNLISNSTWNRFRFPLFSTFIFKTTIYADQRT